MSCNAGRAEDPVDSLDYERLFPEGVAKGRILDASQLLEFYNVVFLISKA